MSQLTKETKKAFWFARELLNMRHLAVLLAFSRPRSIPEVEKMIGHHLSEGRYSNLIDLKVLKPVEKEVDEKRVGRTPTYYRNSISGTIKVFRDAMVVSLDVDGKRVEGTITANNAEFASEGLQKLPEERDVRVAGKNKELLHRLANFASWRALKLLFTLGDDEMSYTELIAKTGFDHSFFSGLTERLESDGLITKSVEKEKGNQTFCRSLIPPEGIEIDYLGTEGGFDRLLVYKIGKAEEANKIDFKSIEWESKVGYLDSPQKIFFVASYFMEPDFIRMLRSLDKGEQVKLKKSERMYKVRGAMVDLGLLSRKQTIHKFLFSTNVKRFHLRVENGRLKIRIEYKVGNELRVDGFNEGPKNRIGLTSVMRRLEFGEDEDVLKTISNILDIESLKVLLYSHTGFRVMDVARDISSVSRALRPWTSSGLIQKKYKGRRKTSLTRYYVSSLEYMEILYEKGKYTAKIKIKDKDEMVQEIN